MTPADADQPAQATPAPSRWALLAGRRIVLSAAGVIVIAGVIVLGVMVLTRSSEQLPLVDVEKQWRDAVGQYGIEPVFPPEEDFAVGDLFVEVVADNDSPKKEQGSFRSRSVKVDHIDVRRQLEQLYSLLPAFGEAPPPAAPGAPPPGLFAGVRHTLPIAALPDVSASAASAAAAGAGGGPMAGLFGMIGFAGSGQAQEKTAFRSMVTYGLTSVLAEKALDDYCRDPKTKDNCTQAVARRHIRSIYGYGSRAADLYPDPNHASKWKYVLTIRFFMVSRVYLTGGIVTQTQLARAVGGGGTISLGQGASQSGTAAQPAPGASGGDTAATPAAVQQWLDALEKQVDALHQGGAASYVSGYDRGFAMDQTFARPVAIGFRSVAYDLKGSEQ
jgi:hypothetical protein